MAVMRALVPAVEIALPVEGWSLVATEAGRYGDGLRASIQLSQNGELKRCYQLRWAYPKQWAACLDVVTQGGGCEPSAAEAAINQLFDSIEGMLRPKPRQPRPGHDGPISDRPEIQVNGRHDREILADTTEVLVKINEPPTLFVRGTEWVSVAPGAVQAEGFTVPRLRVLVGEVADCVAITPREDGSEAKSPTRLPFTVCQDFLAMPLAHAFPSLVGIRPAPVFLPDGRLLTKEGYDQESGLLLRLGDLRDIRDDMSIKEALGWLFGELFVDFPLVHQASKAHLLSLMLEPFARPLIGGKTPLYMIDASTQGSGKGLLADTASVVATGGNAHVMALTGEAEEHDKRITALLMSGASWILLDNVTALDSAALCAVLTANLWRGRLLGASKMVQVPNDATWVCTGNNIRLSAEMARRVIPIRLEPSQERPEDRTDFQHTPLLPWAQQHRGEIISACLSLIRAWLDAGRPEGKKTLGSFESWANVLGGILAHAGISGFLEGRDELYMQSTSEAAEWRTLCEAWLEAYGDNPITAKDVLALAKNHDLLLSIWAGRKEIAGMQRIGHALRGVRGRVFADRRICAAGRDSATKNASFRLVPIKVEGNTETPETLQDSEISIDSQNQTPGKTPLQTPVNRGVLEKTPPVQPQNTPSSFLDKSTSWSVSGVLERPSTLSPNHQNGSGHHETPDVCECGEPMPEGRKKCFVCGRPRAEVAS